MYFGFGDCGDMVMLRFVAHQQPTNNADEHQHYFLTVIERMSTTQLAQKLL